MRRWGLLTAHGSSSFNEANPLQRIWRDVNVAGRHAAFGMGIPHQIYGRALLVILARAHQPVRLLAEAGDFPAESVVVKRDGPLRVVSGNLEVDDFRHLCPFSA